MWQPKREQGIGLLIGLFESLFVTISSNAINSAFAMKSHPAPNDDKRSLTVQPSVLSDDPAFGSILGASLFGLIVWCLGYVLAVCWLLWSAKKKNA